MIRTEKYLETFWTQSEDLYDELKEVYKLQARRAKENLMNLRIAKIGMENNAAVAGIVLEAYQSLSLFPDEDIYQWYESAGITRGELTWFVPIESIEVNLHRIKALNEILIVKFLFLYHVHELLKAKITKWGLDFFSENDDCRNALLNLIRRYKRTSFSRFKFRNDDEREIITQLISAEEKIGNKKLAGKLFKGIITGSIDKYHLHLLAESFVPVSSKVSKNKVYRTLFDLLQLIIKDRSLLTEEQFEKTKGYDGMYNCYKVARVRHLTGRL